MDVHPLNVLISTFPGISPHPTICLPLSTTSTTNDLLQHLASRLPALPAETRLILTTHSRQQIHQSRNPQPLTTLLRSSSSTLSPTACLSLRLTAPLHGGKGGFGSQLRAAGGRMSSRKKKQNAALATGSARNLDGRRLRTVAEAKNLAAYLATKPDADLKEREEKRKRWEDIVEMAERREQEMRGGRDKEGRKRGVGDEWLETKEEVGEGVRRAVGVAMAGLVGDGEGSGSASGSGGSGGEDGGSESEDEADAGDDVMELDEQSMERLRVEAEAGDEDAMWVLKERLRIPEQYLPKLKKKQPVKRTFVGFDDEDEDVSSSEDEAQEKEAEDASKGKGKAVAV